MIPEGTVTVARPTGSLDIVRPGDPGFVWLGRALARRGVALLDDLGDAPHALVGAPPTVLGPARVRGLRAQIVRGLRLLLIAGPQGDASWLVSGLERARGDAGQGVLGLRGRASFDPDPRDPGAGQLWPQGRGWFRFGRCLDVVAGEGEDLGERGRAADPRWTWLQIRSGSGALTMVAGPSVLADATLADPAARARASRILEGWLPSPEGSAVALDPHEVIQAASPALRASITSILEQLAGPGLPPDLAVDPARVPALRALGEGGLARAFGLRVRLSDAGRADLDRVRAVLILREVLRAHDLADEPDRGPGPHALG